MEISLPPLLTRTCGDCAMCCHLGEIPGVKPYNQWCQHCSTHQGCDIYPSRPNPCRSFHCHYLRSELGPEWKPNRCGMVIATNAHPARMTVQVDPNMPALWQEGPYLPQLMAWAAERFVSVVIGEQTYAVYPNRIEDLGLIGEGYTVELTEYETASGDVFRHAKRVEVRP